jgi:hypothetical protein
MHKVGRKIRNGTLTTDIKPWRLMEEIAASFHSTAPAKDGGVHL